MLAAAHAVDFVDISDEVSDEVCVELERPLRRHGDAEDRGAGYAVPETWAVARDALGRGRWPELDPAPRDFADFVAQPDPPPGDDEPLAVTVEVAPHPLRSDRALVRVGLRTRDARPEEREPIHLVALVNVGHSMRSVPTRAFPLLQDELPKEEPGWFYRKIDRLSLAREAIRSLAQDLPDGSRVALAAFDRGAHVALQPTSVSRGQRLDEAIDALQPGFEGGGRGLDVVMDLVRRMRSFCGDTRVLVFSDGPTGLGGDPEHALHEIAEEASRGVTVSTVASAVGTRRVPQLEQLAWVGYGRHHHADTLGDALEAFGTELAEPGWVARDVRLEVRFSPDAVTEVHPWGDASAIWTAAGIGRGFQKGAIFELQLAGQGDAGPLVEVTWEAGSPVPDEWRKSGHTEVGRKEVPTAFDHAAPGVRMAWVAAAFGERLAGEAGPSLEDLYLTALSARREGVRADVELIALIDRARRIEAAR